MPIVRMEAVRWALGRSGEAGADMDARRSNVSGDGAFQFATGVEPSSNTAVNGVGRSACRGEPTDASAMLANASGRYGGAEATLV
jgi:hypothetical protein